jgi:hypothetical protein
VKLSLSLSLSLSVLPIEGIVGGSEKAVSMLVVEVAEDV